MNWFPVGPDFVFTPRNPNFQRLSRRNEIGRQCLVSSITVDPTDSATIYLCDRPSSGGSTAFRTRDEGHSWTPITDGLQTTNPGVDPEHIAVNPDHPQIVYLCTFWDAGVYVSNDRGDTWGARSSVGGFIRKLVVDTRTSSNPATTVLYAATTSGVFRSADGGATWGAAPVLSGDIWSLEAHTPAIGTTHFYAGRGGSAGGAYANDPSTPAGWTNIVTPALGGPTAGSFDLMLLDFCRQNPTRAYAWVLNAGATVGLYTSGSPTTGWSAVAITPKLDPAYGYYDLLFAAAPNSPGDGVNDILVFGNKDVFRSIDAGQNWIGDAVSFHVDNHAIAFFPAYPPAGTIPVTFIGDDGGIAKSSTFANPATAINPAPTDFNEGFSLSDSFVWQNLNHGRPSIAAYQYASVVGNAALSYAACQDTGVAAGASAFGWRGIADADATQVAAAQSSNCVAVWAIVGQYNVWPVYLMDFWRDGGDFNPPSGHCTLNGSFLAARSRLVAGLDKKCLVGAAVRDVATTLNTAVIAGAAAQAVTPASMANIIPSSVLFIDDGAPNGEIVTVTATTATTFSAVFTQNHAVGAAVSIQREVVARVDENGVGSQISQDLSPNGLITCVAPSPSDPNIIYSTTNQGRVFTTNTGATANSATVWQENTVGRPAGLSTIVAVALNAGNDAFVMLGSAITVGVVTSPLFKVSGGNWQIQACSGLPGGGGFATLLADPVQNTVLYTHAGNKVYRLTLTGGVWNWQDITADLPGVPLYDLSVVNAGTTTPNKVLLRATLMTRGVFEADVSAGAITPPIALYVRDNFLDTGWTNPSPDFLPSPYNATDWVTHYQCADIKIDARQNRPTPTTLDFYQTDPEGNPIPPLSHVLFDQLVDNSQNLPQSDQAWVHVQVHNRSKTVSGNLQVWAIYCNASAGVPSLAASASMGNNFQFWSQFSPTGIITPSLPSDSPWKSLGAPQTLVDLDAATPKVASWSWTIPVLSSGDTGHSCMVVFVHSASAPVGETTRMIVDEIAPTNRQVGQKNLHIGPPLPPVPGPGPGPAPGPRGRPPMREYVEFHNPTNRLTETDLEIDLRGLPREVAVSFRLTKLDTARPLPTSISGIARVTTAPSDQPVPLPEVRPGWIRRLFEFLLMIVCVVANMFRALFGLPTRPCRKPRHPVIQLPPFERQNYEAEPSTLVRVTGIRLQPFAFGAMLLEVQNTGTLSPGSEYRFEVRQRARDDKMPYWGGGTYVIKIEGDRQYNPLYVAPSHDPKTPPDVAEEIERKGEKFKWYPSSLARELADQREREDEIAVEVE
jgi:hypothetical protein